MKGTASDMGPDPTLDGSVHAIRDIPKAKVFFLTLSSKVCLQIHIA